MFNHIIRHSLTAKYLVSLVLKKNRGFYYINKTLRHLGRISCDIYKKQGQDEEKLEDTIKNKGAT